MTETAVRGPEERFESLFKYGIPNTKAARRAFYHGAIYALDATHPNGPSPQTDEQLLKTMREFRVSVTDAE